MARGRLVFLLSAFPFEYNDEGMVSFAAENRADGSQKSQ